MNSTGKPNQTASGTDAEDTSRYLRITGAEPDNADPQCTGDYYSIPLNVFDRLVEVQVEEDGAIRFAPSLADSWEISEDGLVYTFHLHEGVTFSNGSPLTSYSIRLWLIHLISNQAIDRLVA